MLQQLVDSRCRRCLCIRRGGIEQAVVIAARSQRALLGAARRQAMLFGQLAEELGCGRLGNSDGGRVAIAAAGAVASFPDREQQKAALEV